jgi:DNA-binding response OmpR family regulator
MSRTPKILIADDDVELLAVLGRHLRKLGVELVEARDGSQALEKTRETKPDLLVLDVMMPGLSGWEVAKRVKDDETLRGTKVIIVTGIGESLNAMTSPLYGADDRLDKPFDFADLDAKLHKALPWWK